MTQLLSALKSYIVLSMSDLTHIKETITRRYAHMTSTERAEILSMAIHNHLNKHLSGIDEIHKESLKLAILSTTLAKHTYSITRLSIFDAIFELQLDDVIKTELAESWLTESVQMIVPRWALENYLVQKRTTPEIIEIPVTQTTVDDQIRVVDQPRVIVQPRDVDSVGPLDQKAAVFFDTTTSEGRKSMRRPLVGIIAALLLLFVLGTPAYYLLKGMITQNSGQQISLTSQYEAVDYTGLSAMDRIYLIDGIEGYKVDNQVYLTLEKSRYDFGLKKITNAFRFAPFDYYAVKNYISKTRNGLIGSSEQFNQIIHEAYLNDIDPLLLFAIIGQEQAFVPDTSSQSMKILNNPYNVYHSWAEYNTTLRDSTQIAINTIKNRLDKAPQSASPFKWLNATYAEDTNWHNGVRLIYAHLVSIGRESSIQ